MEELTIDLNEKILNNYKKNKIKQYNLKINSGKHDFEKIKNEVNSCIKDIKNKIEKIELYIYDDNLFEKSLINPTSEDFNKMREEYLNEIENTYKIKNFDIFKKEQDNLTLNIFKLDFEKDFNKESNLSSLLQNLFLNEIFSFFYKKDYLTKLSWHLFFIQTDEEIHVSIVSRTGKNFDEIINVFVHTSRIIENLFFKDINTITVVEKYIEKLSDKNPKNYTTEDNLQINELEELKNGLLEHIKIAAKEFKRIENENIMLKEKLDNLKKKKKTKGIFLSWK